MSQKFHINKHGVPAPCRATKGNCPFGGESGDDNHFDTLKEAQEAANKSNESQFDFIPSIASSSKEEEVNSDLPKESEYKLPGLPEEDLSEVNDDEKVSIIDTEKVARNWSTETISGEAFQPMDELYNKLIDSDKKPYQILGFNIGRIRTEEEYSERALKEMEKKEHYGLMMSEKGDVLERARHFYIEEKKGKFKDLNTVFKVENIEHAERILRDSFTSTKETSPLLYTESFIIEAEYEVKESERDSQPKKAYKETILKAANEVLENIRNSNEKNKDWVLKFYSSLGK